MNINIPLNTPVDINSFPAKMQYRDSIFLTGSCFTEHIAHKLERYKYHILSNPFGILYNPSSIAKSFHRISQNIPYKADELVFHDGLFHSMDHHGSFSGGDVETVLINIHKSMEAARSHLLKSRFVFVSLGTSRVFRYITTGEVVGNNHKLPQANFLPYIFSVEECMKDMESIYQSIHQLSPDSHVIWTVSPIRHLKNGLVDNQRSKAVLVLAIENFIRNNPKTNYFPAYEIMLDQLRDYRYYSRDMIHPSEVAIDIIWEVFCKTYIDSQESEQHPPIEKVRRAMEHRLLHENHTAIKSFAESQLKNIDHLASLYPDMNWKEERQYFFHLIEPD